MSLAQQTAYQQHLQGQEVQLHTLDRQALEESLRRSITLIFWYKVWTPRFEPLLTRLTSYSSHTTIRFALPKR